MPSEKQKSILFIKAINSAFNDETDMFDAVFASVEKVSGEQKALKLIYNNSYDIIISDMSVHPREGTTFMKQIKEMKPQQKIVSLMVLEDEDKLGDLIDAGIDAFVLTPEQFEQALEAIAQMDGAN